jgi:tyrosine-specific transport protein
LELNLQAGHGFSLGALGRWFSGKIAGIIGTVSLKVLSYSLLAVFIYGGSSILKELLSSNSFNTIATCYACITMALLLLPIKIIDYLNRFLFVGLLAVVAILLAGLVITMNWSELPLFSKQYRDLSVWMAIIPVVFTSFGFQVIFHTLSKHFCGEVLFRLLFISYGLAVF